MNDSFFVFVKFFTANLSPKNYIPLQQNCKRDDVLVENTIISQ